MKKEANLINDLERITVELTVSASDLKFLEDALIALRFFYLFDKGNDSFKLFNAEEIKKAEVLFNKNTLIESILNHIKKEKIFKFGPQSYSLDDLSSNKESIIYDSLLTSKVSLHEIVKFRPPEEVKFIADPDYIKDVYEDIDNAKVHCKDMDLEATEHFLMELMELLEFDLDEEKFNAYLTNEPYVERIFDFNDFDEGAILSFHQDELNNRLKEMITEILDNNILSYKLKTKILRNLIFNENHDTSIDPVEYFYKRYRHLNFIGDILGILG